MRRSACVALLPGLVAVAFVGAVAVGCTGDDDTTSGPPPTTDSPTAAETACTLLTPGDAAALFGAAAQPRNDARPGSVASQCIYESAGLDGQLVQFRIFDNERYSSKDLVEDGTALEGLGRRAYLDPQGPGGIVDLQFVRNGKVYALAYSNTAADAATRVDQVEALARTIAARL